MSNKQEALLKEISDKLTLLLQIQIMQIRKNPTDLQKRTLDVWVKSMFNLQLDTETIAQILDTTANNIRVQKSLGKKKG